ncbi:hypothetical protein V6N11_011659 [Hibiscus sabdariffa]|uniref:RNase H type-1 domain-containing protein n=1 Tax=Hibiscus sabdariffa TaxID=183260 RepID=A0ABR2S987_9ROSI
MRLVWSKLLPSRVLVDFLSLRLQDWILANINQHGTCNRGEEEWPVRFAMFCWLAWKKRCSLLFDGLYVERGDFVEHGLALATNSMEGFRSESLQRNRECDHVIAWRCPKSGWVKLNADGSVDPQCGAAAADSLAHLAREKSIGSITFAGCPAEAAMALSKDNLSL